MIIRRKETFTLKSKDTPKKVIQVALNNISIIKQCPFDMYTSPAGKRSQSQMQITNDKLKNDAALKVNNNCCCWF